MFRPFSAFYLKGQDLFVRIKYVNFVYIFALSIYVEKFTLRLLMFYLTKHLTLK